MVNTKLAHHQKNEQEIDYTYLPSPLKYTSIPISETIDNLYRLEASAFSNDSKIAKEKIINCRYGYSTITGKMGICKAYRPGIIKRNFVEKKFGVPMYTPAQITELYPKPHKFLSKEQVKELADWMMVEGELVLTCSGTVGNVSMVSKTLKGKIFSQNMIRLYDSNYLGYIYSFLQTKEGKSLITSNNYGAVIQHIDPEHLNNIIIPDAPEHLKKEIHELVMESYDQRDQSNELIDRAEQILYEELQLKLVENLGIYYFDQKVALKNYTVKLSELNLRLDCSYHQPKIKSAKKLLRKHSFITLPLGDQKLTKSIYTGNRFKRVYVDNQYGFPYLSGKHIMELNPGGFEKKYLSRDQHATQIKEQLMIKPNTLLITCSGTTGKIVLIPKHWEGWVGTHDLIRVIPRDDNIAGYLFCLLNSEYGQVILNSFIYGAVVDHIEASHVASMEIPILKNIDKQKEINNLVLKANELRYQAYITEQKAIKKMEEIML